MNKIKSVGCMALCALLLVGCDSHKKDVKNLANEIGRQASKNMIDSVAAKYPQAAFADSLALAFHPDSIEVSKSDQEGIYDVRFNSKASMKVKVADDGSLSVTESKGLFYYPAEKIAFAKKVGAFKDEISDAELAKKMINVDNMSSSLFKEYVESRKNAIKNLGFTVTREIMFMMDTGEGYFTLKNTTDKPISADEYEITWSNEYIGFGIEKSSNSIGKGNKDIPANGTVRIYSNFTGHDFSDIRAITMKTPSQKSFFENFEPKGTEYADYVKVNGEVEPSATKLSDGPYVIAGKLGGKYPIHINLEKGMEKGTYYYDKSGPSATLDLVVKSFNPRSGDLVLQETNAKGDVTGTFTGKMTADNYKGEMRAFTGKTYEFDLAVQK